jgi:hypothetical protein
MRRKPSDRCQNAWRTERRARGGMLDLVGGLRSGNAGGNLEGPRRSLPGPREGRAVVLFILCKRATVANNSERRRAEEGPGRGATIGLDERGSTSRPSENASENRRRAGPMDDRLAGGLAGGGLSAPLVGWRSSQWRRRCLLRRSWPRSCDGELVSRCERWQLLCPAVSVRRCAVVTVFWRVVWRCALFTVGRGRSMTGADR